MHYFVNLNLPFAMQSTTPGPLRSNASLPDQSDHRLADQLVLPGPATRRLQTADLIRGFALLGILMMNIMGFALPHPTVAARLYALPHDGLDFRMFDGVMTVFEGTMRALFSMLFGAGVLLFPAKKDDLSSRYTLADFYYRRLFWLILFGVINAYVLLWPGDILYTYGLCGLFLFPFRKQRAVFLLAAAGLCFLIAFGKGFWTSSEQHQTRKTYLQAIQAEKQKKPLTNAQKEAKAAWLDIEKSTRVDPKKEADFIQKIRSDYDTVFAMFIPINRNIQSVEFYQEYLWDALLMMFLGMALF